NGSLAAVVTTHQHSDHWQALQAVVTATGALTAAGEYDADDIPVHTDLRLRDGETINVGNIPLRVIHLVGHTPGAVALLYDDPKGHPHLFTGDSLAGVETHGLSPAELLAGALAALPDETWVYPARGNDSPLGAERAGLG